MIVLSKNQRSLLRGCCHDTHAPLIPPACHVYPAVQMAAWKVAPALAAGNCCVLKPSELASVTCLELAAIAEQVRGSSRTCPQLSAHSSQCCTCIRFCNSW